MYLIPLGFPQQVLSLNLSSKPHKIKVHAVDGGSSKPTLRAHQKVDLSGSISPVPGQDSNREAGLFEKELRSKSRGLRVSLRLFRLGGWREGQHALTSEG